MAAMQATYSWNLLVIVSYTKILAVLFCILKDIFSPWKKKGISFSVLQNFEVIFFWKKIPSFLPLLKSEFLKSDEGHPNRYTLN